MTRWLSFAIIVLVFAQTIAAKPVPPADKNKAADSAKPRVVLETNAGRFVLELDADKAPITVKNFLRYVDDKFYDGTIFHRVIADFMIQGGGHGQDLREKSGREPIKNEGGNGLSNLRGTIAAARTSVADSATSQFFINTKDNAFLDRPMSADKVGYAVFGKIVAGMDTIDRIRQTKTENKGGHNDVPIEPVVILSARRVTK